MVHIPVRKPRIAVVSSEALSTKSLRAKDYVFSPREEAKALVDAWVQENPLLNRKSKGVRDLERLVEGLLIAALDAGDKAGRASFARLM